LSGFLATDDLDWSPASSFLAVLTTLENGRSAIWTVHPDGSQQHKVIEKDRLASIHWSPAGNGIYFFHTRQGGTQDLLKVGLNAKSGQAKGPTSLLLSGLQTGGYFTVSTDGTRLAYTRFQAYSNLWLAQFQSSDNGKATGQELQKKPLTSGTASFDSPSISPDGKWIAFVDQGHIYKMPSEGGTSVQLTFSNATESSPAWSPDGKRIAFGSNVGGAYKDWVGDADGTNRRQFARTQLSANPSGAVTWSPGNHILYQTPRNRNFNILDPETEEEKSLVQNESIGWLFNPIYSPDGMKVAAYWNRGLQRGLWLISLIDNSEILLRRGFSRPAGWSPDGSSVYAYVPPGPNDPNGVGSSVLSIPVGTTGGGDPHTVFSIPEYISAASVSPDGKKFVFSAMETKSDVWIVDNFDPAYRKQAEAK
jgi:Tol biopolymer transport system component